MPVIFIQNITVVESDIDSLNHANNEVYLRWLIDAATLHSKKAGWPMSKYLERQEVFVVRRHELDYLASAYLGDDLQIETWIDSIDKSKAMRHYKIVRIKDSKILLTGKTLWIYISMQTGRPIDIPEEIKTAFT